MPKLWLFIQVKSSVKRLCRKSAVSVSTQTFNFLVFTFQSKKKLTVCKYIPILIFLNTVPKGLHNRWLHNYSTNLIISLTEMKKASKHFLNVF